MKNSCNIPILKELQELATLFYNNKKTIYIVGGYIRDFFTGKNLDKADIDVCSECKTEEIIEILKNSEFSVKNINKNFGTLKITTKNNKIFEHATFRKEKYNNIGDHYPITVEFINNIKEDCLRRDFTCNAIYYDIINNKFISFFNLDLDIFFKLDIHFFAALYVSSSILKSNSIDILIILKIRSPSSLNTISGDLIVFTVLFFTSSIPLKKSINLLLIIS